jgi:hypothetical protein
VPLNMDPRLKGRLEEGLRPIIEAATVHGRKFLDSGSIDQNLRAINPALTASIRETLACYISDDPMYDYVFGQLSQELSLQAYDGDHLGPLSGLAGFEDSAAVAARLVNGLDALPKRYAISMRLPDAFMQAFEDGESSIQISTGVFVRNGAALVGDYEAPHGQGLMGLFVAQNWEADAAYVQVEFDGFIGKYVTTESQAEAVESLYAFLGAAKALGAVKVKRSLDYQNARWSIAVHEKVGAAWSYLETEAVGQPQRDFLSSLAMDDQGGALRPEFYRPWLRDCLRRIGYLFGAKAKSQSRLLLGCKWLFDSYSGDDQLLQYIQATVVVETLLGDKAASDQVGLGALLGNRCAYLIGYSSSQRDELLEDFRQIYDVRSRIVHGGKSRLKRKEADLFYKLRWICGRIIQREAELLMRDNQP